MVRIISLDGGGQLELTSSLLLQEIEKVRPGFLARTQILAGTSAGAMAALVLASQDDPADALPQLSELWEQFDELIANSPVGTLVGLLGLGPVFSRSGLEAYLAQPKLLGTRRLGDLKKLVVVPAFQLDGVDPRTKERTWKAKIYHNFGPDTDPDMKERALSVCLRSGAAPVAFPIMDHNFIDGGAVANDPSVIAIAQVLHRREKDLRTSDTLLVNQHLRDIRLLSIGVGRQQTYLTADNPDWGFINWLLNPTYPLLLVEAFSSGSDFANRFVCERLLGNGYFRLNPYYATEPNSAHDVNTEVIRKSVAEPSTQAMIKAAVAWMDESGWMDDDTPRRAARTTKARTIRAGTSRKKMGGVRKTTAKRRIPK